MYICWENDITTHAKFLLFVSKNRIVVFVAHKNWVKYFLFIFFSSLEGSTLITDNEIGLNRSKQPVSFIILNSKINYLSVVF